MTAADRHLTSTIASSSTPHAPAPRPASAPTDPDIHDDAHLERCMPGVTSVMRAIVRGRETGRRALPGFAQMPLAQHAAILLSARNHPDGLTHRELVEDGLASFVRETPAADIDAHLAKFGLVRHLRRNRAGSWTYDRAIEVIARETRESGRIPTSSWLTQRKGDLAMAYHTLNRSPGGFRDGLADLACQSALKRYPGSASNWDPLRCLG